VLPPVSSQSVSYRLTLLLARVVFHLKMQEKSSSETSVYCKPARCHIVKDSILRSHRRENLKPYTFALLTDLQS
jgi:hypothetical protein